jgi:hypothetical protein
LAKCTKVEEGRLERERESREREQVSRDREVRSRLPDSFKYKLQVLTRDKTGGS